MSFFQDNWKVNGNVVNSGILTITITDMENGTFVAICNNYTARDSSREAAIGKLIVILSDVGLVKIVEID